MRRAYNQSQDVRFQVRMNKETYDMLACIAIDMNRTKAEIVRLSIRAVNSALKGADDAFSKSIKETIK